jgi:hypothetical protein
MAKQLTTKETRKILKNLADFRKFGTVFSPCGPTPLYEC